MNDTSIYCYYFAFDVKFLHRSKLTGVVAGYILLFMGFMGCNMLLAMHLQQHLKVLPVITTVKPIGPVEELKGAAKFRNVANDMIRKLMKKKEQEQSQEAQNVEEIYTIEK